MIERLPIHGRLHHVATVVRDLEVAVRFHRDTLGLPLEQVADVPSQEVRIAFLTAGDSKVELVSPTNETSGVARFLAAKGEGFHHVCLEVADIGIASAAGVSAKLAAPSVETYTAALPISATQLPSGAQAPAVTPLASAWSDQVSPASCVS